MRLVRRKVADRALDRLLVAARDRGVELTWDRHEAMQPQCGFGELGLCCRRCLQGPCRIDPFGAKARSGACGMGASDMAAVELLAAVTGGLAVRLDSLRNLVLETGDDDPARRQVDLLSRGAAGKSVLREWLGAGLTDSILQADLLGGGRHGYGSPSGLLAAAISEVSGPGPRAVPSLARLAVRAGLVSVLAEMGIQLCRESLYGRRVELEGPVGISALRPGAASIVAVGEFPPAYMNGLLSAAAVPGRGAPGGMPSRGVTPGRVPPGGVPVLGIANPNPHVMPLVPSACEELVAFSNMVGAAVFGRRKSSSALKALLQERGVPALAADTEPSDVVAAAVARLSDADTSAVDDRERARVRFRFGRDVALESLRRAADRGRVVFLVAGEPNVRATVGGGIGAWLRELSQGDAGIYLHGEAALAAGVGGEGGNADAAVRYPDTVGSVADMPGAIGAHLLANGIRSIVVYPEMAAPESLAQAVGLAALGAEVVVAEPLPFWMTGDLHQVVAEALEAFGCGGRLHANPRGLGVEDARVLVATV